MNDFIWNLFLITPAWPTSWETVPRANTSTKTIAIVEAEVIAAAMVQFRISVWILLWVVDFDGDAFTDIFLAGAVTRFLFRLKTSTKRNKIPTEKNNLMKKIYKVF